MNRKTFVLMLTAALCLANATSSAYRSHFGRDRFDAENAARFRYTRMIAGGERIPALDRRAQWPEGVRTARETPIGMEHLYGRVWRALSGPGPDAGTAVGGFPAWVPALLFSLAVVPLALLSSILWRSRGAGILAAFLFALAPPIAGAAGGMELAYESPALALIALHAWLVCAVARPHAGGGAMRRWAAVLSALVLFAALAAWQGTQFYLVLTAAILLARLLCGTADAAESAVGWATVAAASAAGALVPFLRAGLFLVSPAMAPVAGWAAAALVLGRAPVKIRRPMAAIVAAAAIAAALFFSLRLGASSHLLRLAAAKLRHVYKPSDPSLLPFAVRAAWTGTWHSPDALQLFVFALPLLALLPVPGARLVRMGRGGGIAPVLVVVLSAGFLILFLLMQRLLPLFAVFAVVVAGGWAAGAAQRSRARSAARLAPAVAALSVMASQALFWAGQRDLWHGAARAMRIPQRRSFAADPLRRDPQGEMLAWIRRATDTDDVVLSSHNLSPQILAYTGRATVLNDFLAAPRPREKARRFLQALYSSEKALLEFSRGSGADWLVLSAAVGCDPTRDSPLYLAGLANMPPDCAAYRLMFDPRRLESFDLAFENEMYRVFRVGVPYAVRRAPRSPLLYERELLWRLDGDIREFYETAVRLYAAADSAAALERAGRSAQAQMMLEGALRTFYFYPAWRLLDRIHARAGRSGRRLTLARFAREFDPWRAGVCLALAESALEVGELEAAAEALRVCSGLAMDEEEAERFRALGAVVPAAGQKP